MEPYKQCAPYTHRSDWHEVLPTVISQLFSIRLWQKIKRHLLLPVRCLVIFCLTAGRASNPWHRTNLAAGSEQFKITTVLAERSEENGIPCKSSSIQVDHDHENPCQAHLRIHISWRTSIRSVQIPIREDKHELLPTLLCRRIPAHWWSIW